MGCVYLKLTGEELPWMKERRERLTVVVCSTHAEKADLSRLPKHTDLE